VDKARTLERRKAVLRRAVHLWREGREEDALVVALAASFLPEAQLEHLVALEGEEVARQARSLVRVGLKPLRRPPPWGWSFMQEVLQGVKAGDFPEGVRASVSHLAYRGTLYRAQLAWAMWKEWGSSEPDRFAAGVRRLVRMPDPLEARAD